MMNMGAELLDVAVERDVARIDERLFFDHFTSLAKGREGDVVRRRSR
ncbi:MAG: hypothetical protein R3F49_05745 [Planctomycetota bacterium]